MAPRSLVVHGHFYQPPREDPRTGRGPSGTDWNGQITEQCYAANADAPIMNDSGEIIDRINNYAWMSFNFGPTLLSWIEDRAPALLEKIVAADRASVARLGHGNAIAQAYSHAILPLCNVRDLKTEIRWGMDDFRLRFGRQAEGMWLPETACSDRVLDALAAAGLRFALLAPRQAAAVRARGDGTAPWEDRQGGTIDTRFAYHWRSPYSDRSIALYFYDGGIARAIAFDGALHDSANLVDRIQDAAAQGSAADAGVLVHAATDGESYGHHFRYGERCLAYALTREAPARDFFISNYGRYLSDHPPTHEARIVAGGSSWSCEHGVERWFRNCGCVTGEQPGDDQGWRGPLRDAMDGLRDAAAQYADDVGARWGVDMWALRDGDRAHRVDPSMRHDWLAQSCDHLDASERERVHADIETVLAMQRSALAMYTSCGWFFSDIAGIEARIVLRHAASVCATLALTLGDDLVTRRFEEQLRYAKSHRAGFATGADVFRAIEQENLQHRG
jgi:alpha-amylase/alpha-mannosidase (GH57 family)